MMLLNNNATTSRSGVKAKKFSALDGRGWSSTDSTVELILEFFITIFNEYRPLCKGLDGLDGDSK